MEGVVDYRGRPILRSASGRWTAALFIIGVEIAERSAYGGIAANLISYLTGPLGEPTAAAAVAVNVWCGASSLLPLVGAFVADSYLGRYRTIAAASLLYLLGLAMLTLSTMLPTNSATKLSDGEGGGAPARLRSSVFYFSLYLIALAQGGHKPCVQAFGADQFDESDPEECRCKSSFFNWWYFGMCGGAAAATFGTSYVQDNVGWGLGFGVPCALMAVALAVFLIGSRAYRCYPPADGPAPFARMSRQLLAWPKRWGAAAAAALHGDRYDKEEAREGLVVQQQGDGRVCEFGDGSNCLCETKEEGDFHDEVAEAEEARRLIQLLPIWAICSLYAVILSQPSTFFTKQASTLDRRVGNSFRVPSATLQCFIGVSIVAFVPVYDRIVVPVARKFTRRHSGITMLQRIGTGMALSVLPMVVAALVERKRLKTAEYFGLTDQPNATIPMSLWWMVPQYLLYGIADVFTMVGLQEFFYDQVPVALRSLGIALYLSTFGVGDFVSGFLVSVIDNATARFGESWFSSNLNRGHLDYFYWLLAGLCAVEFVVYLYFARSYQYKKKANLTQV